MYNNSLIFTIKQRLTVTKGHLKDELDYKSCATFEELEYQLDNYIDNYNNKRYQWTLKKMTPVQYRDHLLIA